MLRALSFEMVGAHSDPFRPKAQNPEPDTIGSKLSHGAQGQVDARISGP